MLELLINMFEGGRTILPLVFVGGTSAMVADTNHQAAIPASAPVCVMETVKAEGGNYYFSRQKPGVCRL